MNSAHLMSNGESAENDPNGTCSDDGCLRIVFVMCAFQTGWCVSMRQFVLSQIESSASFLILSLALVSCGGKAPAKERRDLTQDVAPAYGAIPAREGCLGLDCSYDWAATPVDVRLMNQRAVAVVFLLEEWDENVRILCDGTIYERDDLRFYCSPHGELTVMVLDGEETQRFPRRIPPPSRKRRWLETRVKAPIHDSGCSNLIGTMETSQGLSYPFRYLLHVQFGELNIMYCEPDT